MRLSFFSLFIFAGVLLSQAEDDITKYAVWITGEVFTENDYLLFRADKPVRDNTGGSVVLLGATKATANVLLPCYVKAAERHMTLRLYGVLMPDSDASSDTTKRLPNVQFITWKMHLPSDPDDLPDKDKVIIGPDQSVPGYEIHQKK